MCHSTFLISNVSLHIPNLHDNNHYEKHVGSDYLSNFEDLYKSSCNIVYEKCLV